MEEHVPVLISSKRLKQDFDQFQKIVINSENFTIGRGLHNSAVIPCLFLSRDHCILKKVKDDWILEDCSSFGIEVNGKKLGKGQRHKLCHQDMIKLESTNEFVYKFILENSETYIPCKRRKLTDENEDIINNMRKKFEESQSYEIQHIEDKIQNAKHMQTTSKILKEQLQLDLSRKEQQLHFEYAAQIEKLKGKKNEVEQQKALLIEERDAQLAAVKVEMEGKIASLMEQIAKHNQNETELIQENNSLKDKLLKEREEFLSELNRESSSKQEIMERLEGKIREQEEVRLKEKKELEESLRRETEQLRLAKEKELKELEAEKKRREMELEEELKNIKNNLAKQIEIHENEKREAEQLLNEQKEHLKKVNYEERVKIHQLIEERGEIEKQLALAHTNAETSIQNLKAHVEKRETELAALAADRIQQQADQSSEVISSLQAQLEKVRGQLQSVESEKNTLLESISHTDSAGEGCSKQATVADVEELMESELTCSICSELFIKATTLNCSHTFCKYCIDKWKKNKRECPICRTSITSECKSIVLDSLIERMSQTSEETKQKREHILKAREELEAEQLQATAGTSRYACIHYTPTTVCYNVGLCRVTINWCSTSAIELAVMIVCSGSSTDDDTDDRSETDHSEGSGAEDDYHEYGFDDYGGYDDYDYPDPDGYDGFDEYDYTAASTIRTVTVSAPPARPIPVVDLTTAVMPREPPLVLPMPLPALLRYAGPQQPVYHVVRNSTGKGRILGVMELNDFNKVISFCDKSR
ncbi:hypothetical protein MSG28_006179 [Choristoneura fumiferana]|uniref:Uncharacterized protein n=1 Tax=Choristoneura fumiferana TaxID=7141 RepID=A0ACC0JDV5_CHOFU|nr:hypothetical protein MSG28_006179 [Choristoneura fumiferana]